MPIDRTNWFVKPQENAITTNTAAHVTRTKCCKAASAPQTEENTGRLLATLQSTEKTLLRLLSATQEQIRSLEDGKNASADQNLSLSFTTTFAQNTIRLQNLVYQYSRSNWLSPLSAFTQMDNGSNPLDVGVQIDQDGILIYSPYLPPRGQTSRDLITDQIQAALCRHTNIPSWPHYHIAFTHIYHPSCPARDPDNYNYKPTIDAIAFALCKPDSSAFCSLSMDGWASETLFPGVYIRVFENTKKSSDFSVFEKMQSIVPNQDSSAPE